MLGVTLAGCVPMFGPSPERLSCLNYCADDKDACMLSARNANEVHWCDNRNAGCVRGCPR